MDDNCIGTFGKRTLKTDLLYDIRILTAVQTTMLFDIHEISFLPSVRWQEHKMSKLSPWQLTKMNKYRNCFRIQTGFCDRSRT